MQPRVFVLSALPVLAVLLAAIPLAAADDGGVPHWTLDVVDEIRMPAGRTMPLWISVTNHGAEPADVAVDTNNYTSADAHAGSGISTRHGLEGAGIVRVEPGETERVRIDITLRPTTPAHATWRVTVTGTDADGATQTRSVLIRSTGAGLPLEAHEAVLAAGVGASVGLAGWFAMSRPRVPALLLAPLAPLYTRLARSDALAHETRAAMHARIQREPGIPYATLMRETRVGTGAFVHHLRVLERAGLVVSRRQGSARLLFPAGEGRDAPPRPTDAQARILDALAGGPRTQIELAETLGLTQQGVSYHLRRLEQRGLVAEAAQEDGKSRRWRRTES